MRPRTIFSDTTTPIRTVAEREDSPALRRLITVGLLSALAYGLVAIALPALNYLFPGSGDTLHQETLAAIHPWRPNPYPEPALPQPLPDEVDMRWHLISLPLPLGRVWKAPSYYVPIRNRGVVPKLPGHPQMGDLYQVGNIQWVWMVPFGTHTARWVDP